MNIFSLNPDSVKEERTQRDTIKILTRNKIRIATNQERHIAKDRDYILDTYRIITSTAAKKKENRSTERRNANYDTWNREALYNAARQRSSRIHRVTLDHENSNAHTQILTTYAPDNGHTAEGRKKQLGEVEEIPNKTCK